MFTPVMNTSQEILPKTPTHERRPPPRKHIRTRGGFRVNQASSVFNSFQNSSHDQSTFRDYIFKNNP